MRKGKEKWENRATHWESGLKYIHGQFRKLNGRNVRRTRGFVVGKSCLLFIIAFQRLIQPGQRGIYSRFYFVGAKRRLAYKAESRHPRRYPTAVHIPAVIYVATLVRCRGSVPGVYWRFTTFFPPTLFFHNFPLFPSVPTPEGKCYAFHGSVV